MEFDMEPIRAVGFEVTSEEAGVTTSDISELVRTLESRIMHIDENQRITVICIEDNHEKYENRQ